MRIVTWMEQSGVAFGTSGARGLVAAMTDAVCFVYTVGFIKHLQATGDLHPGGTVALAGDLRPSTPRILRACLAAVRFMDCKADFYGNVPTPALCNTAFTLGIPSLMVTGSHIPADRNGIKFNRSRGEFLKADEGPMREQDVELPCGMFDMDGALIAPPELPPAIDVETAFIDRYRDFFGPDALAGLRLGIYQHSAVGRDLLVRIVEALGAEAVPFGRSETFIPVDTEALRAEDVVLARERAADGSLHAILTLDGDSDRPLLADWRGEWIRGDVLGILAARFLEAACVVTPISSNTALEKAEFAKRVYRTKIGSPFVVAAMSAAANDSTGSIVGYEANGGFLLGTDVTLAGRRLSALPTRDSILPMVCALMGARAFGDDLVALTASLPLRFTASDRLMDMPTALTHSHLDAMRRDVADKVEYLGFATICGALKHVDNTDGLRLVFASDEIVHLRASGNAPELRVYVESGSAGRSKSLLSCVTASLQSWRNNSLATEENSIS